jgi:Fe2+ or Zn2+ uptake regulation protein
VDSRRDKIGLIVPLGVLSCRQFTPSERVIYSALPHLVNGSGHLLSNEKVCQLLGVKVSTVTRALRKFRDLGLIEEVERVNGQRYLRMSLPEGVPRVYDS